VALHKTNADVGRIRLTNHRRKFAPDAFGGAVAPLTLGSLGVNLLELRKSSGVARNRSSCQRPFRPSDLTVAQEQDVRSCEAKGLYPQ
jgi:hypothetical protein